MNTPAGFFQLPERSILAFSGVDAARYLNGQLSIDILRLAPGTARTACLLDAKGRLCAHLPIWRESTAFLIEVPCTRLEEIQTRLERYIIADDVTVTLATPPPTFHILGHPAPAGTLSINRLGPPGHDTPTAPIGLPELTQLEIERLRIIHGIPVWDRELTPSTLPQEAHLEATSVDFDKGCYVGQETVSRLKSVGRVNKLLHGFRSTSSLPDGSTLHLDSESPTPIGRITSTAPHFDMAQTVALGYLNRQYESAGTLHVRDPQGRPMGTVERHPFPIP